jgi:O-Antigen ligase
MNFHRQRQWFFARQKFYLAQRCHSGFHRLACGLRMSMHAVSLQKTPVEEVFPDKRETPLPMPEPKSRWDECLRVQPEFIAARWANRLVLIGIALFALSLPHSIAAAHVSLILSALAWITRDMLMRRFHFQRTPLDVPLATFAALTLLSTIFSAEPSLSFPKLKSLLLFGALYVLTTNLSTRALKPLLALLLLSGLCGVLFSIGDRLYGRGVIIKSIAADSPLLRNQTLEARLQPGDAIWMIGRLRVYSLSAIRGVIRSAPVGTKLDLEALHRGDPVPATITVTEDLKAQPNPLGLTVGKRTHRFRVTGFGRQFQTYAEQMQLFALLCYGLLLMGWRKGWRSKLLLGLGLMFVLFSIGLMLTFTRAVLVSYSLTLLLVPLCVRGKRAALIGAALVLLLGGTAFSWLGKARSAEVMRDSTLRRFEYMQAGLRVIPQHPLLGTGMDAVKRHWQEWGFPGVYVTHTHSTPIQIAMERGLIALLILMWLWWTACRMAWGS